MIEPIFVFCFLFVAVRYMREEKRRKKKRAKNKQEEK